VFVMKKELVSNTYLQYISFKKGSQNFCRYTGLKSCPKLYPKTSGLTQVETCENYDVTKYFYSNSHILVHEDYKVLYRIGGTCWDYRLSHSIIHTPLFADFTRLYYNRSVTNSSLTNCVDHSLFPSTLLTVDYFR
jgi:hypothetical protein